jgi:hypothetical protein
LHTGVIDGISRTTSVPASMNLFKTFIHKWNLSTAGNGFELYSWHSLHADKQQHCGTLIEHETLRIRQYSLFVTKVAKSG